MPAPNVFQLFFAFQSAQGVPADAPDFSSVVRSSGIMPNKETAALEETGQGRDQPAPVVTRVSGGGNFELYARPVMTGLLGYAAMGSVAATQTGTAFVASTAYTLGDYVRPADTTANPYLFEVTTAGTTGTTEPVWPADLGATVTSGTVVFTNRGPLTSGHLETPADDQPWLTVWRHMFGTSSNRLVEKFMDCKVSQFQIAGEAGQPAMVLSSNLVGLMFKREQAAPILAAGGLHDTSLPIKFVDYVINTGGVRNRAISSFTYNLEAGINTAQTDSLYDSYAEPGPRTLAVNFNQVYTNLDDYNRVFYGGPNGLEPSAREAHAPVNAAFKDGEGRTRLTLDIPHYKYGTASGLEPNASAGEISRMEIGGNADIPLDGGPVSTAEVVSEVANYAA